MTRGTLEPTRELLTRAASAFRAAFAAEPTRAGIAPGRVNLIGEHVDYNGGIVLPLPLPLGTAVALRPRDDGLVRGTSSFDGAQAPMDSGISVQARIDGPLADAGFLAYPIAAVRALRGSAAHRGFDVAIASDLPVGAGLSSSAALLVATLRALDAEHRLAPVEIADLAHVAETRHVGVNCGRMDQLACAVARPGHALRIDCRSGHLEDVALPWDETAIVVADSGTRRELKDSAYNTRVSECAEALASLRLVRPGIATLRDATPEDLALASPRMSAVAARRAGHVIREIARVVAFIEAMKRREFDAAGRILSESHADLRDAYEVSAPALDAMQSRLEAQAGCFGARMTGAGFAGCLVALVDRARAETVAERAQEEARSRTGRRAVCLVVGADDRMDGAPVE